MWYVVAGLLSLCLGLEAGPDPVASGAQPAEHGRILVERDDGHYYAVTPDGAEVTGPLATSEPVGRLTASPDGRFLAAVPRDEGGLRIFRVLPGLATEEVERLRPGLIQVESCMWSPDGHHVAVLSSPRRRSQGLSGGGAAIASAATPDDALLGITAPLAEGWTLHILHWHDTERHLPNESEERAGLGRAVLPPLPFVPAAWPAWAPRSDALAYVRPSAQDKWKADGLCVTDLATGHSTTLPATGTVAQFNAGITWSPDGRRLAYAAESPSGIIVVPADGSAPGELLVKGGCQPSWSPTGSYLAFARSWGPSGHGGGRRMGLWVLDLESGRLVDLTVRKRWLDSWSITWSPLVVRHGRREAPGLSINPWTIGWSPDGSLIAFCGEPLDAGWDDEYDVYVADPLSGAVSLVAERRHLAMTDRDDLIPWLPPAAARGGEGRDVGGTRPK